MNKFINILFLKKPSPLDQLKGLCILFFYSNIPTSSEVSHNNHLNIRNLSLHFIFSKPDFLNILVKKFMGKRSMLEKCACIYNI